MCLVCPNVSYECSGGLTVRQLVRGERRESVCVGWMLNPCTWGLQGAGQAAVGWTASEHLLLLANVGADLALDLGGYQPRFR